MNIMLRSSALACTVWLAGCAVGPDFHRPDLPASAQFTREPQTASIGSVTTTHDAQQIVPGLPVEREWWHAFHSPALDELVQRSLAHSPTIDAAKAALRQANEDLAAQRASSYFPLLAANYSASRQQNAVGTISPTLTSGQPIYTLHTAQATVGYVPDVFGLNRRTVEAAHAQADIQNYDLQAAYLTLAANVVSAAVQEANLRAQIDATNATIDADAKALSILQLQAAMGGASALDVAAQATSLAQAQQTLPALHKQLEQTRDLIAMLAGSPPSDTQQDFDLATLQLPAALPMALPSQVIHRRPDVLAAEAQVHAASAQVGIAVANRLPQFSITGQYGGASTQFAHMFDSGNVFWALTGNVTQTLFDFGALKHHQRAAEAALDQAAAQYRSVALIAFQNVADTLYALTEDSKALAAATQAETATRKTRDLTRQQWEFGGVNGLALLTAEQAYQQARITKIQAYAARYADTVALYQALGGGWNMDSP